jgi:hypothetical protein
MKKSEAPSLFFSLPLKGNSDRAVAAAYDQFLRERGLHHGLGGALEYVSRHAPAMKIAFSRTHSHRGAPAAT